MKRKKRGKNRKLKEDAHVKMKRLEWKKIDISRFMLQKLGYT